MKVKRDTHREGTPRERGAQAFVDDHREEASSELYGIADLAKEFGITHRAIRLYESKGLLQPKRLNGARIYSRRDRARLILVLRAKALGSTLDEIKEYLDLYGQHGEGRTQQLEFVIAKTAAAIEELEAKKRQLDETLAELRVIQETCQAQLSERRRPARARDR
ncbi:MerR family DNA-binding transcriptional regulator [Myxococcota bacterium]|nr:MerR family DNA-binding transcriptional regulator [Myxococcota bacterium]